MRVPRCGALGLAAWCAAGACWPQTLRIPDFRQASTGSIVSPGEPCSDCGRIVSIREIDLDRSTSVPPTFRGVSRGPVEHNLVGAVVYLPLTSSSADRPFIGGVGTPEMRERFSNRTYEIVVQMNDGTTRSIRRGDGAQFTVGERIRLDATGTLHD